MSQLKMLYLVRHAKSSWEFSGLTDRQRPLNKRGRRDAPLMGQRLAERAIRPELIVSSPAVRALTTAQTIARELSISPDDVVLDERIYGADPSELIEVLRDIDDRYDCIMLVGHNPGLTDLVDRLTGEDLANVPTCGIAMLSFALKQWGEVGDAPAQLLDFDYPKKPER